MLIQPSEDIAALQHLHHACEGALCVEHDLYQGAARRVIHLLECLDFSPYHVQHLFVRGFSLLHCIHLDGDVRASVSIGREENFRGCPAAELVVELVARLDVFNDDVSERGQGFGSH